jgi:hypothetical protein
MNGNGYNETWNLLKQVTHVKLTISSCLIYLFQCFYFGTETEPRKTMLNQMLQVKNYASEPSLSVRTNFQTLSCSLMMHYFQIKFYPTLVMLSIKQK